MMHKEREIFNKIHNDFALKMVSLTPCSRKKKYIINVLTN